MQIPLPRLPCAEWELAAALRKDPSRPKTRPRVRSPPLFEALFFDGESVLARLRSALSMPVPRFDDLSCFDIALSSLLELPSKKL